MSFWKKKKEEVKAPDMAWTAGVLRTSITRGGWTVKVELDGTKWSADFERAKHSNELRVYGYKGKEQAEVVVGELLGLLSGQVAPRGAISLVDSEGRLSL